MGQENRELVDIPGHQLLMSSTRSNTSRWTEIGEAEITHTIFGRAKVRINRKGDKARRAMWLTAVIVLIVSAAIAWQGWMASRHTGPEQDTELLVSEQEPSSTAASPAEGSVAPAAPAVANNQPAAPAPAPAVINKPPVIHRNVTQAAPVVQPAEPVSAHPVAPAAPATATATAKPQLPPAGSNIAVEGQAENPVPPKRYLPRRTVAPAATPPAASSPAAATPLAAPVAKPAVATQSPQQPADPVSVQGQ